MDCPAEGRACGLSELVLQRRHRARWTISTVPKWPNVSNHLAKLREGGLVRPSRVVADTRRVYYERDDEACRQALDALGEVLG